MKNQYTTKDTLNSISWQLKRIADALETIVDKTQEDPEPKYQSTQKVRSLLESLKG